jgi:hypothetical protein
MGTPVGQPGRGQLDRAALPRVAEEQEIVFQGRPLGINSHARMTINSFDFEHGDVGIIAVQGRDRTAAVFQHRSPARDRNLDHRPVVALPPHHEIGAVPDHVRTGQDPPRRDEKPGTRHRPAGYPNRASPQEILQPVRHPRPRPLRGDRARTTQGSP